jgi:hypothetical protein
MHANAAGFSVHSPIDLDLSYDPRRELPWEWEIHGAGYSDDEIAIASAMPIRHQAFRTEMIRRRTKLFLAGDDTEPKHTAQIWTGCIFDTPPGWSLLIRSPINRELGAPFRIQEAILESDWHRYDIWMNLEFVRFGETARLRRDGPPIAHLLPLPRQSYDVWDLEQRSMAPGDPEAEAVFNLWVEYNWEKFHARSDGKKDPTTYARRRQRFRGKRSSPG